MTGAEEHDAGPAAGLEAGTGRPTVTFVIAAYRAADTVGDAIGCALSQTGVEIEVIVVDDASPDKAVRPGDHPSGRVRVHRRTENGGPAGARNDALDMARGEWIAVLDADDVVEPGRTEAMLRTARAGGFDIVVDNIAIEDHRGGTHERGTIPERRPMHDPARWNALERIDLAALIGSDILFGSSGTPSYGYLKPMISRDFVERHGLRYDTSVRIGEDFQFLATALSLGARCGVHRGMGYVYRLEEGSISQVLTLGHVAAMQAAAERFARNAGPDYGRPAVQRAVARRMRGLDRARAFLEIVEALKARRIVTTLRLCFCNPSAAALLRLPVVKRLRALRFARRTEGTVGTSRSNASPTNAPRTNAPRTNAPPANAPPTNGPTR